MVNMSKSPLFKATMTTKVRFSRQAQIAIQIQIQDLSLLVFSPQRVSLTVDSWSFFTSSQVDSIMSLYPNIPSEGVPYGRYGNETFPDYGTQWRRVASIFGDVLFIGPCRLFSNISSFTGNQRVYRYRFNTTDPSFDPTWGATHGIEIGFVWNSPSLKTDTGMTATVNFMSRAWASFVVDLNPNNHGLSGIPTWNTYSASSSGQNFVVQNGTFTTEDDTFRLDGIGLINNAVLKQV
jgi:acetylcholinesterase